jgi:hypothetical protein
MANAEGKRTVCVDVQDAATHTLQMVEPDYCSSTSNSSRTAAATAAAKAQQQQQQQHMLCSSSQGPT